MGYADNSVAGLATFSSQSVDMTSVLVKYTFYGDSDLDGDVDVADLGNLASNWQSSAEWVSGDFDYSGFVDVADLGMLASNWQSGVSTPLAGSLDEILASLGLPSNSVPEPGSIVWISTLGASSLMRSRRHRCR